MRRMKRCLSLFLAVALTITLVRVDGAGKVVEAADGATSSGETPTSVKLDNIQSDEYVSVPIGNKLAAQRYAVLSGTLTIQGGRKEWATVGIGLEEGTVAGTAAFRILYEAVAGQNQVKLLNTPGSYESYKNNDWTWNGLQPADVMSSNVLELENAFGGGGVGLKVVRLDTWAYLYVLTEEGYKLIGRIGGLDGKADTSFYLIGKGFEKNSSGGSASATMKDISVKTGKDAAVAALDGSFEFGNEKKNRMYFPMDSTSWTVEGKLTTNVNQFSETGSSRYAILSPEHYFAEDSQNTHCMMLRYNKENGTHAGMISNGNKYSAASNLNPEEISLLSGEGLWVRWVRDGQKTLIYTSVDGKEWRKLVEESGYWTEGNTGIYVMTNGPFGSKLTNVKLSTYPFDMDSILKGVNVSLEDNIGVNFYMDLPDDIINNEKAYVEFVLPGKNYTSKTIMVSSAPHGEGEYAKYMRFSCDIAAKEMISDIQVRVFNGQKFTDYFTCDVRMYGKTILEGTYSDKAKELVRAMLNYGTRAQEYFGYFPKKSGENDDRANWSVGMTDGQKAVKMPTPEELGDNYKRVVTGETTGLAYYGTSLMLTSKTAIRHYFTLDEGAKMDDYKFECDNKCVTVSQPKASSVEGRFYVEIQGITAVNLDEMYTLTVSKKGGAEAGLTLKYGPYTNIRKVRDSIRDDKDTRWQLMAALYRYSEAAKAYQNESNSVVK